MRVGLTRKVNKANLIKWTIEAFFYLGAILVAFLVGGLVMSLVDVNPIEAYGVIWNGAVGNMDSFKETLIKATPLLFAGLAYTFAYRSGLFNIGAEGQIYVGALTGAMVALLFHPLPFAIHLPITLVFGMIGGALWAGVAGWLKVKTGSSEIISTIMLNYVGIYLVSYMVTGPLKEAGGNLPQTASFPDSAIIPRILDSRLHYGFFIAICCAIVLYWILNHTSWGYEIRSAGLSQRAPKIMGIPVDRNYLLVMMVSGAMAGLGGIVEIAGVQQRLLQNFSPGFGYDGIAVALVGGAHPIGNIASSILFGGLRSGANSMQRLTGTSTSFVYIIQAIIIILVLCNRYWFCHYKNNLINRLIGIVNRPSEKSIGGVKDDTRRLG
ncbi:MAG: ABC transporter permease [Bacillota bacterium]